MAFLLIISLQFFWNEAEAYMYLPDSDNHRVGFNTVLSLIIKRVLALDWYDVGYLTCLVFLYFSVKHQQGGKYTECQIMIT